MNNPRTHQLLVSARDAVAHLHEAFVEGLLDPSDALAVAGQLHRLGEQVRSLHYRAVAAADESGMWALVGYLSTDSWLRHTHRLSPHQARTTSRTARWLQHQPDVAAALGAGEINDGHVQALRRGATSSPTRAAAFGGVAQHFVDVARNADSDVVNRAVRSWADAIDEGTSDRDARREFDKRHVYLSPVGDGWDLQGWLPAAEGAELAGLLTERIEQSRRESPDVAISGPQRRADALLDLARSAAAAGMSPGQRDRAKVSVLIPLARLTKCANCRRLLAVGDTLGGTAGGTLGSTSGGTSRPDNANHAPGSQHAPDLDAAQWRSGNGFGRGTLPMSQARRLACDGAIQRVVLSAKSAVLDVGRSQRLVTPAIRAALDVRDGGCVVPGCDRPPGWCEAHHIVHWADGGETSLHNLALTCARHHHEIHQGRWHIAIDGDGLARVSLRERRKT